MLVDNKFIFLSLPRCASTSFHVSFLEHGLDVKYVTDDNLLNEVKRFGQDDIIHVHENLEDLTRIFGKSYPIVSIKRNPYERYISMWRHVISESSKYQDYKCAGVFSGLNSKDLLCYQGIDISNHKERHLFIIDFLIKIGLKFKEVDQRILTLLNVLITPIFLYHKNNPEIIWFDFEKIGLLEKWISDRIGINFKVSALNSSKDVKCGVEIDQDFRALYDKIYSNFENHKEVKTLI